MIAWLEKEEVENLLSRQIIGRIGCHSNGTTYVVPISYAYDGTNIYAHSLEGMKLTIMRQNPSICFEVEYMNNLANWRTVICQGIFEEIVDPIEKEKAFRRLSDRNISTPASETMKITPLWPFAGKDYSELKGVLFKIKLIDKTGKYERST